MAKPNKDKANSAATAPGNGDAWGTVHDAEDGTAKSEGAAKAADAGSDADANGNADASKNGGSKNISSKGSFSNEKYGDDLFSDEFIDAFVEANGIEILEDLIDDRHALFDVREAEAQAQAEAEAQAEDEAQAQEDAQAADDQEDASEDAQADEQADAQTEAQKQAAEWQDKYMRLHAEWDTYRRRQKEQAAMQKALASEKLVSSLIPVIDDLERSIDYAQKNGEKGLLSGVEAVLAKFIDTLQKDGVEIINPKGEAFEALEAQAVGTVDDPSQPDETVADVYQKGYKIGTKVLRPAMVTVTTGGPARPKPEA